MSHFFLLLRAIDLCPPNCFCIVNSSSCKEKSSSSKPQGVCIYSQTLMFLIFLFKYNFFFFFRKVFDSCYMRIVPIVTILSRSSTNLYRKAFTTSQFVIRKRLFNSSMSVEATKSRQQPPWIVPTSKQAPVLKFQNSLTKTKVN